MNSATKILVVNVKRRRNELMALIAGLFVLCNAAIMSFIFECDAEQLKSLTFADFFAAPLIGGMSLQPLSKALHPIPFQWMGICLFSMLWTMLAPLGRTGKESGYFVLATGNRSAWFVADIVWLIIGALMLLIALCVSSLAWTIAQGAEFGTSILSLCNVLLDDDYLSGNPHVTGGMLASFLLALFFINCIVLNVLSRFGEISALVLSVFIVASAPCYPSGFLVGRYLCLACYASISSEGLDAASGCIALFVLALISAAAYWVRVDRMDISFGQEALQ